MTTKEHGRSQIREDDASKVLAFTIRLTPEQARLITQAAEIRGWSPSAFMKDAAVERAANVINCSTPRSLPLRETVERLAEMLCTAPEGFLADDVTGEKLNELNPVYSLPEGAYVSTSYRPLGADDVGTLENLSRFGGIEFLKLLVARCRVVAKVDQITQAQPPIDPAKLMGGQE